MRNLHYIKHYLGCVLLFLIFFIYMLTDMLLSNACNYLRNFIKIGILEIHKIKISNKVFRLHTYR